MVVHELTVDESQGPVRWESESQGPGHADDESLDPGHKGKTTRCWPLRGDKKTSARNLSRFDIARVLRAGPKPLL